MILELNLRITTVAAAKATVDGHLESVWRASGVRILRSDLPFCGIRLKFQNKLLATDDVLSRCRVRKTSTLYAEWPSESEKDERRKRYGKGRDKELVPEKKTRRERREKSAVKKALSRAVNKESSALVENPTESTPNAEDEEPSSGLVSGDPPGDNTEVEVGDGMQGLSELIATAQHDVQQEEQKGQEDGQMEEMGQDDPFAEEDDNKENQPPTTPLVFMPIVEDRAVGSRAEEELLFDETYSGSGMDLVEGDFDF